MEIYLKQKSIFSIAGTDLFFSESSKNWMDYAQALEYVKNMGGRLPVIEELALLRVATYHSKEQYTNVWRDVWKYQATNTFAFFWKKDNSIFMYIENRKSPESNYAIKNIDKGIKAHTQNKPWIIEMSALEWNIESHFLPKPDDAVIQIRVDSLTDNTITSQALHTAASEYTKLLKELQVDYFHIQIPSNEQLKEILQSPRDIVVYAVGLGGDDSGINELICNQTLLFRNKATAVITLGH